MDTSVIGELKKFEEKERLRLEQKKASLLEKLAKKKLELAEANKKELEELIASKKDILKDARKAARKDGLLNAEEYKKKSSLIDTSRVSLAVDEIFREFKNAGKNTSG